MRRSKTASTISRQSQRNFVKEGATYKLNKQTEKQIVPGTYTLHHPEECENKFNGLSIHLKRGKSTDRNERVKVTSQENVRDLLVPMARKAHPSVFPAKEIERIKTVGNEFSRKERLARFQEYEINKKRLEEECEKRKMLMKEIDRLKEEKKRGISEMTENEYVRGKILDRAFVAQHEQAEEIQRANRLILATKCHVIRDAQIAEKYEIEKEIREEDNRLDKMMLEERDKALKLVDINEMKQKMQNAKIAEELKLQRHQREVAKLLEAERIEDEAKKIAKAITATNAEMDEQERLRKKDKQKIKEELERFKQLSEHFKNKSFEEQRIADMKAQEYMRAKQARDKAVMRERQLKLEQQQREADALLKLQTKLLETKNEQEEMDLRRNQEEKEREFRRKEKEAAIKKKALEKDLEIARATQLKEHQQAKAIEMTRDKMEFDIALAKLMAEEAKEKEKQEKVLNEQEKYRIEIKNQIEQKEILKRERQRLERIEFMNEQEKEKERVKNIQTIIKSKINGMRDAKIPEKFVRGCERQLQPTS